MKDSILDDLNEAQRAAVAHGSGPLMVLAGAGSGKTRVITRRIARLMRDGVPSHQILALTFTNKAAGEMAKRVRELGGGWVRVATFHSACARFLRDDGHHLGYPRDFTIYDTYDRDTALKQIMQDKGLDKLGVRPAALGRRISQLKNVGMTPDDLIIGRSTVDQCVESCFREYQELLLRNGALDFDDLLGKFVELLQQFPDVAETYRKRFQWLLVDEFQDTNRVQYDLLRKLVESDGNICVVGDPDQSIYRFRGADIRNILDFERDYPTTVTVRLEQNYRSSACILRAAESVIRHNTQRKEKRMLTERDDGEPITVSRAMGPAQEAREIAERIEHLVRDADVDLEQIAVFYRSHFLSRGIEEALREHGIPHRIVGGVTFFERREIKDLLAYLRVLANPLDDISMARAINVPARGIGPTTLARMRELGAAHGVSLAEVICDEELRGSLPPRARKSMAELADVLLRARAVAQDGAHGVLRLVTEGTGYIDYIGGLGDPEDEARVENVKELHSDAASFDADVGGGLAAYLQHVSLMTDADRQNEDGLDARVSLMTVHAAKGLEFDHVFVAGLEEGLFPHARSIEDEGEVEEERRLMYVALTRARETLWLGSCRSRMVNGLLTRQQASSFLDEIEPGCLAVASLGDAFEDDGGSGFGGGRATFGGSFGGSFGRASRRSGGPQDDVEGFEVDAGCDSEYSQVESELAPGVRVVHAVYGRGTVLDVQGRGLQAKVRVSFDKSGSRLLVVEHAGLRIAPTEQSS